MGKKRTERLRITGTILTGGTGPDVVRRSLEGSGLAVVPVEVLAQKVDCFVFLGGLLFDDVTDRDDSDPTVIFDHRNVSDSLAAHHHTKTQAAVKAGRPSALKWTPKWDHLSDSQAVRLVVKVLAFVVSTPGASAERLRCEGSGDDRWRESPGQYSHPARFG